MRWIIRKNRPRVLPIALAGALVLGTCLMTGMASTGGKRSGCGASARQAAAAGVKKAKIGKPAPEFTLKDLDGNNVSLSTFKGKIVVLEWFNPECPFVKLAHSRTLSLKEKARSYANKGVVWIAVNSNGPHMQGHGVEKNRIGKQRLGFDYPVLLDPGGDVGRLYGAERTPHMFVIDPSGKLVYRGAIDNTAGGDPEDAEPPPARNYIDEVIPALMKNRVPPVQDTTAWGCSVKYAP